MATVKIAGKERKIRIGYGKTRYILGKYLDKFQKAKTDEKETFNPGDDFFIDIIWTNLTRRWFGLKPFITKTRMRNAIGYKELGDAALYINEEIFGKQEAREDREPGKAGK
jgi:hypothetical protein